jgi:hypothetical protein
LERLVKEKNEISGFFARRTSSLSSMNQSKRAAKSRLELFRRLQCRARCLSSEWKQDREDNAYDKEPPNS